MPGRCGSDLVAELPIRKTWTILLIAAALAAAGSMWFFFLRASCS